MDEENKDNLESENQDNGGETVEKETTETTVEDGKDYKKMYEDQRQRAEKAEKELKNNSEKPKPKESKKESKSETLSNEDLYSLVEAKIPREDVQTVQRFAELEGKSVSEVLADQTLKTILKERQEIRNSAAATNTGNTKRTTTKVSVEQMVRDFESGGEMPENDEDLKKMILARQKAKR